MKDGTLGWSERPNKQRARDVVLKNPKHSNVSIWLPGSDAICFQQAIMTGFCDKTSHAYLVESDRKSFLKLEKTLKKEGLYNKTNIHVINGRLEDFNVPEKVDFAFIDLLGTFTTDILLWLDHLSNNITQDCQLYFTHLYKNRNNQVLTEVMNLCENGEFRETYRLFEEKWQYFDKWVSLPAFQLKCCFNKWQFDLVSYKPYRDKKWKMILYQCNNFHPCNPDLLIEPSIETILSKTNLGKREIDIARLRKQFNNFLGSYREFCNIHNKNDKTEKFEDLFNEL
jgi:hypothetical protein